MKGDISIVFLGSGPVALQSLRLLSEYVELEAIITKPTTEESMRHAFPEVPIFTVQRRKELDELCMRQKFQSKLGILIDFGVIVDQTAIDSFPLGIINSHFSLLPELRGVDPITFALLSGQKQTGVSLMRVVRAWDEGPLLAQAPYNIPSDTTAPELTQALIELSNKLLADVIPKYIIGEIQPQDQIAVTIGPKEPTYTHKLTKEDGQIDWNKSAVQLEREVRAFIQWPKTYTTLAGREVVITKAGTSDAQGDPGTVYVESKHLFVHCGEGSLEILRLKPAGKPEMDASAFLAGYRHLL